MNNDVMMEIVETIKEQVGNLKEKEKSATPYERGLLHAYVDVLRIIQEEYAGYDLKEIGLDIDVLAEYM